MDGAMQRSVAVVTSHRPATLQPYECEELERCPVLLDESRLFDLNGLSQSFIAFWGRLTNDDVEDRTSPLRNLSGDLLAWTKAPVPAGNCLSRIHL
jgi:hypothetical protein